MKFNITCPLCSLSGLSNYRTEYDKKNTEIELVIYITKSFENYLKDSLLYIRMKYRMGYKMQLNQKLYFFCLYLDTC